MPDKVKLSGLPFESDPTSDDEVIMNKMGVEPETKRTKIGNLPFGDAIPEGLIAMWSGTLDTIPTGWNLCDGTNGTPDLRDRFIVGAAEGQNPGSTGGSLSKTTAGHTHTNPSTGSAGSHSHGNAGVSTGDAGGHGHSLSGDMSWESDHVHYVHGISTQSGGSHSHTLSGSTASAGSIGQNTDSAGGHQHSVTPSAGNINYGSGFDPLSYATTETVSTTSVDNHAHYLSVGNHSHSGGTLAAASAGSHTHGFDSGTATGAGTSHRHGLGSMAAASVTEHSHSVGATSSEGAHTHTQGVTGSTTDSIADIRPPYFALAFIMKAYLT